jgi:PAS domain S-box-containing protein
LDEHDDRRERRLPERLVPGRALDRCCDLVNAGRHGVAVLDADCRVTEVNQRLCDMTGVSADEIIGVQPSREVWTAQSTDIVADGLHRALADGEGTFESVLCRGDGTTLPVRIDVSRLDDPGRSPSVLCLIMDRTPEQDVRRRLISGEARLREAQRMARRRDVSELVEAHVAARRESDFHQATFEALEAHVAVLDDRGRILATNHAWERFARDNGGIDVGVGANYIDVCAAAAPGDEDATTVLEGLRAILAGTIDGLRVVYPCHGPGQERWFALRATRRVSSGATRVVVKHQDVTAHRRAEMETRMHARLLDELHAAVIATDLTGAVTHWSTGAECLYGWTRDETVGRVITDLIVGPQDVDVAAAIMEAIRRDGRWEGEFDVRRKDGTSFPAHVRDSLITDEHGRATGVVGVSLDITDRVPAARSYGRRTTTSAPSPTAWGRG